MPEVLKVGMQPAKPVVHKIPLREDIFSDFETKNFLYSLFPVGRDFLGWQMRQAWIRLLCRNFDLRYLRGLIHGPLDPNLLTLSASRAVGA